MDFAEKEQKILEFWSKNQIFRKLREKNKDNENWSFLDGPITANNAMGVHHAWGRTYKDLFQRHKAMQGYNQRFQNGFDCQGLWVEVEVEKEKGFKNKKDIEEYGVEKFIQDCKNRVLKYSQIQTDQSIRLGQWMDWDNSYYTMSEENNYAIWGFLKKCHEKELLYKGKDVVPWCLRCGTAISQHEILTENYKEIIHKSVFLKCALVNQKNTYFLVWTTTPWTLIANTALAVHPDLTYIQVVDEQNNKFILLKEKQELIKGTIEKEFLGKELLGLEYESIFKGPNRSVVLWKDVNIEEGTGIVHIAPGCGQEDFKLGKELNLETINPLDDESCYKIEPFQGKRVDQVNDLIFEELKNKIYKIQEYQHRYPVCWRCKSELIFRLVPEWYISMEKLRTDLIKVAQEIKWIPEFSLDREIDWLNNMQDWLISKKRYWGLALPIFECSCGNFEVIGSKEELKEKTISGWQEDQSPHKQWLDKIKIKCSSCGDLVSRIPDVGNPWLDAGMVPFSTMGYYQNKEEWSKWFPADLICESFPGQFKNWFYALIVMSTVLEETKPVKSIFGYATVKDEKGEPMHKSSGNAIWLSDALDKMGADPIRWVYIKQNPTLNLNFGYKKIEENQRKLMTLKNVFVFFNTHIKENKETQSENILDKWIISKLNNLIAKVTENLNNYNSASAALSLEDFFINDLSLWYLRRSRKRLQEEQSIVFYQVLLELLKLMAPFTPFLAEDLYAYLKKENMPESVHLLDWPKSDQDKIDQELEQGMDEVRKITSEAMAQRADLGIKTRQPLLELKIKKDIKEEFKEILKQEVNVKKITIDQSLDKNVDLNSQITPELKEEGLIREIIRQIQSLRKKSDLKPENKIEIYCFSSEQINQLIERNKELIIKETIALDVLIQDNDGQVTKLDNQELKISIKNVS